MSANHEMSTYIPLLDTDGVLVMLGITTNDHKVGVWPMVMQRKSIAGSSIGGIRETQEVIDFCHKHKIRPEIKIITDKELPEVYEKLAGKNDSITRYVLDIVKSTS